MGGSLRSRRAFLLLLAAASLLLVPASVSIGPLGPSYPLFAENAATFPDDALDASGDCSEFEVGVGVRDATPGLPDGEGGYDLWREPYEDANDNGVYDAPNPLDPTAPFDPYTDENSNGKWDGPYMAGYGHEEEDNEYYQAVAVHDPVWARALAFRCGELLLGMVSVDTVGLFQNVVWQIRERVVGMGFDHVVVASTHTHDSVDTMGLWGPNEVTDGKDPRTMSRMVSTAADALVEAAVSLEPVSVRAGHHGTQDPGIVEWAGYVQTDLRDPFVIDDVVLAAQFLRADDSTLGTLVNWSPHPETLAGTRSEISSDFPDRLRRGLELEGATVGNVTKGPLGGSAV